MDRTLFQNEKDTKYRGSLVKIFNYNEQIRESSKVQKDASISKKAMASSEISMKESIKKKSKESYQSIQNETEGSEIFESTHSRNSQSRINKIQ